MRRGAIAIWIIITLAGWGFVEIWPKAIWIPEPKQIGTLKYIEKEGFISRVYVGDGVVTAYNFSKDLKPGDIVEVQGNFVDVLSLNNQGYARYLKSQGIHWTGRAKGWKDMQEVQPFYFWRNAIKNQLDEAVDYLYRGDGFLVKALLYGDKEDLDQRIKEDFARTGTAHVLALSGFHTGILALLFHKLLFFIPTRQRTFFIGVFLLVYCFFTGMRPSILRATVFFLILYGSFLMVRRYDVISTAAITASVFTAYNPYLIYDIGFQLSFLSVVSIGMFLPMMESLVKRKTSSMEQDDIEAKSHGKNASVLEAGAEETRGIQSGEEHVPSRDSSLYRDKKTYESFNAIIGKYTGRREPASSPRDGKQGQDETKQWLISAAFVTMAAQILTMPVVAFYFHQVSLVSVLANIILLPGITFLMTGYILSLLTLPLFPPGSRILAGAARMLMRELLGFVEFLGSWKWAALDIGEIPLWVVLLLLFTCVLFWRWWEFKKTLENKIVVQ